MPPPHFHMPHGYRKYSYDDDNDSDNARRSFSLLDIFIGAITIILGIVLFFWKDEKD